MNSSITIARVFGIPIRIELTWLIIFAVLLIPGGLYYLPNQYPHWSPVAVWTVAGLYALLFFASILLHELAHSLVAKLNGIPVQSITLWLFGGVAHLTKAADRPRTEALISIVGPGVNMVIGAALFVYLYLSRAQQRVCESPRHLSAWANAALAIFNLMPGLPLDGGQLLRSAVWAISHNREKGTVYASLGGCGVAILVCAGGVSMVYFLGQWLSGLWLGFIGFWMLQTAIASYRAAKTREAMSRFSAFHLMSPYTGLPAPPDALQIPAQVNALVLFDFMRQNSLHRAFVTDGSQIVGVIEVPLSRP